MRRMRTLIAVLVAGGLTAAGSAVAAAPGSATCSGGPIAGGTYKSLTVTGLCFWAGGDVTITGNLTVADGAVLNDHDFSTATVTVGGNVKVGKGAVLGLGSYNPFSGQETTVAGNIIANQPLSLYLSFITVHGNVVSHGGGGGVTGDFRNFPTKDITVDGNMVLEGWTGGWMGVIRDQVGGNLVFINNASVINGLVDPPEPGVVDPDSSEVQTNVVGGNLICHNNIPAAQVNPDDGGQPNSVGGQKIGECAGL